MAIAPTDRIQQDISFGTTTATNSIGKLAASSITYNPTKLGLEREQQQQRRTLPCGACICCADTCGDSSCIHCKTKSQTSEKSGYYYTTCQVRRHNTEQSAWIVVGNNIYDATRFLDTHPGGKRCILKKSGGIVDCTQDFEFHSKKKGQKLWQSSYIGKINRNCPADDVQNHNRNKQWWMFWM